MGQISNLSVFRFQRDV